MEKNREELEAALKRAEEGSAKDIRDILSYDPFEYPYKEEYLDYEKVLYWLSKLYYADQNEYDKLEIRTNGGYKAKFLLVRGFSGLLKVEKVRLSEEEQLNLIKYIIDKAANGDHFYCILASEVFSSGSDDNISLSFNYKIRKMMYDRNKAISYLKKAVSLGSGVACNMLGDRLSGWKIDRDFAEIRAEYLTRLIMSKDGCVTFIDDEDATEDFFWTSLLYNDYCKVDFDLAKQYYELGVKMGNDICKDRLKDYDKRIIKTQRLIGRSIPEDVETDELLEDEDIEALLDWFKDKFPVGYYQKVLNLKKIL